MDGRLETGHDLRRIMSNEQTHDEQTNTWRNVAKDFKKEAK